MSEPGESAEDVRAIRVILRTRKRSGRLPFYDRLIWDIQDPENQVPNTASTRLLFGVNAEDGKRVYVHYYIDQGDPDNRTDVIGYHEDGNSCVLPFGVLFQRRWCNRGLKLELPFHHFMGSRRTIFDEDATAGAYIKACFSLRGVTRGIVYEISKNFKASLSRSILTLTPFEGSGIVMMDTGGSTSQRSFHRSKLSSEEPAPNALVRKASPASTSSQASEVNTMDFNEDDVANHWKCKPRGARNTRSTTQFGMFPLADSHNRSEQYDIALRPINSQTVGTTTRRKAFGMFGDASPAKRAKVVADKKNNNIGRSTAECTVPCYLPDTEPMDDDEDFLVKQHHSTPAQSNAGTASAVTNSKSGLERTRRERSSTSSLSAPLSPSIHDQHELGKVDTQGDIGTMDVQDVDESASLDTQAQEFLKMEAVIEHGGAKIVILEQSAQSHLLQQTTSEQQAQHLQEKTSTIEKQLADEGVTRKEEARKRLEAQMAVEMMAIDEDIGKKIELGTAAIQEERTAFARSIEESLKMRQDEEEKIKEEQRVMAETREKLQTLKKIGGFDLGEVVSSLRQQKK